MKCMSKKAAQNKRELEAQREREAEEIRWNNLTPEEQKAELIEREARRERAMQTLSDMGKIMNYIDGPYGKF